MATRKKVRDDRELFTAVEKHKALNKKYRSLLRENQELRREFRAALEIRTARTTHTIKPRKRSGTSEATAVAIASDWHVEEEVKPSTVMGLNKYNLDIAKQRADTFFERIVRLVAKERQDVAIKELVVGLLGDMITGKIHEENLENCLLRPVEAIIYAQELIESGIVFLLEHTDLNLTFVCHCGN